MNKIRIACVEDEAAILRLLEINLQAQGFQVFTYNSALKFLARPAEQQPDLLILDVMMPEMDGFELCRRLRQDPATRSLPIIMLTARGEEIDRVVGLEIGADDYLTKPFSVRELIARIRALLRRSQAFEQGMPNQGSSNLPTETDNQSVASNLPTELPKVTGADHAEKHSSMLHWGSLSLNLNTHQAFCNNKPMALSGKEYELLKALMEHPGWVVTREGLLEQLWGFDFIGETRTVDMHIANLRRKLEQNGGQSSWIQTLRGVGYRLATEVGAE